MKTQTTLRYWAYCTAILTSITLFTSCEKSEEETGSINEDDMRKISETMGHYIVDNLNQQNLSLDIESFIKGIEEAKTGKEPPLNKKEFINLLASYRKKAFDIKSSENLKIAEDFLEDNRKDPQVVVLEDGKLQYKILEAGNGNAVNEDGTPLIHYEGKFIDGNVFDSSEKRGTPIELSLKSTIPGFKKGMSGMKEGERRRLFIHPDLGYGNRGRLPPNSLIIFDIEVVEAETVKPEPANRGNDDTSKESSMSWLKRWTGS